MLHNISSNQFLTAFKITLEMKISKLELEEEQDEKEREQKIDCN